MEGESIMSERTVIVGGGVSGLAAAVQIARRGTGREILVLESQPALGGRAASGGSDGYALNFGPHALYARGERALRDLGVEVSGGIPSSGYAMEIERRLSPLPSGALSLLASPAFGWRDKWALAKLLLGARGLHDPALDHLSVERWLEACGLDGAAADLARSLVRITSYSNAPALMSAGAALTQIRASFEGVRYLDGGWATIVDGLRRVAEAHGVTVRTEAKVESLRVDERVRAVVLQGGEEIPCDSVVLTLSPKRVVRLLGDRAPDALRAFAREAPAARAACLDVALARLPERQPNVVLGIDRPLYYSVHSHFARLAPDGAAVIHAARYLAPGEHADSGAMRAELEELLDGLQPGWRDLVVEARWSPAMTVAHAIPEASRGGLGGRPDAGCVGRGIALAGDWVGPRGMLVDAALFSAEDAARAIAGEAARAAA